MRPRADGKEGLCLEGYVELEVAHRSLKYLSQYLRGEFDTVLRPTISSTQANIAIADAVPASISDKCLFTFNYDESQGCYIRRSLSVISDGYYDPVVQMLAQDMLASYDQ